MALKKTDYDGFEEVQDYKIEVTSTTFSKTGFKKEMALNDNKKSNKKPRKKTASKQDRNTDFNDSVLTIAQGEKQDKEVKKEEKKQKSVIAQEAEKTTSNKSIYALLFLILLIGGGYYLYTNHSEQVKGYVDKAEKAITDLKSSNLSNQEREAKIKALNISPIQREAIRNGQIFKGANFDMVKLALGNPDKTTNKGEQTEWHYNNATGQLETKVIFENGKVIGGTRY